MDINYIKHLNNVFILFSKDSRLNPTHISLYVALFQIWNNNFFKDEFYINREEVMDFSKIGSKSTYHRCIKELSHWNYLLYIPSHNPFKGSRIKMFNFSPERSRRVGTSTEQVLYPSSTKIETSTGQALVPINKHIQTIENPKNINKRQFLENSNSENEENGEQTACTECSSRIPYQDNLKTSSDKNYDEPL
jgi:DNA-directed RNA polymerase subunit RPC12/RpoP